MKKGLLLINVGTPTAPTPPAVRTYLREFLMDPYVVDIAAPFRWTLVHGMILPFRPKSSAEAYSKIWTEKGSPLLIHTCDLAEKVQAKLGGGFAVEPAMRYGTPSILDALQKLLEKKVREIEVFPLYPQYSLAATASAVSAFERARKKIKDQTPFRVLEPFYSDPGFLNAFEQVIRKSLEGRQWDHLLFSFHGLPERQVKKTDPSGAHCLNSEDCCQRIGELNSLCYRAHCFETARRLASELELPQEKWSVSFQSRLGRTPWIKPYTDVRFQELAQGGVKRLAVACPSFVADCLETLEEIRIRGAEQFRDMGGEELFLIPSLNSEDRWAGVVAEWAKRAQ